MKKGNRKSQLLKQIDKHLIIHRQYNIYFVSELAGSVRVPFRLFKKVSFSAEKTIFFFNAHSGGGQNKIDA